MTFIQPCFIRKNTPELRKKLEDLGYKPNRLLKQHLDIGTGLVHLTKNTYIEQL